MDNNIMISFSNFKDNGNVKTFKGQEYIVYEDKITHQQYQGSEAQFHSLFDHWYTTGAINMKKFLTNKKMHIMQEIAKNKDKITGSRTSLFLHNLPLQGKSFS